MTANAMRSKHNNQNSNNNGSAKLTCTKKCEMQGHIKQDEDS